MWAYGTGGGFFLQETMVGESFLVGALECVWHVLYLDFKHRACTYFLESAYGCERSKYRQLLDSFPRSLDSGLLDPSYSCDSRCGAVGVYEERKETWVIVSENTSKGV